MFFFVPVPLGGQRIYTLVVGTNLNIELVYARIISHTSMIFTTAGIYVGFCKKGGTDIHSIRIPVVGAIYNHHDLTKYQVLRICYVLYCYTSSSSTTPKQYYVVRVKGFTSLDLLLLEIVCHTNPKYFVPKNLGEFLEGLKQLQFGQASLAVCCGKG